MPYTRRCARVATVDPPTYDAGVGAWSLTARTVAEAMSSGLRRSGTGVDETAALRDLDDRLRPVPQPDGSRVAERERRLRLATSRGPRDGRENTGRRLTASQLEGVLQRFP